MLCNFTWRFFGSSIDSCTCPSAHVNFQPVVECYFSWARYFWSISCFFEAGKFREVETFVTKPPKILVRARCTQGTSQNPVRWILSSRNLSQILVPARCTLSVGPHMYFHGDVMFWPCFRRFFFVQLVVGVNFQVDYEWEFDGDILAKVFSTVVERDVHGFLLRDFQHAMHPSIFDDIFQ